MIPKIIHYCWFGTSDKPEIVKKCISTWKKHCPEYEFIEWNDENFDANCNSYVKEAYKAGKFAFVADYVRLYALYNHGGIYMDTDVEVFKTFDDILNNKCVMGFEEENYIATSFIAAEKENGFIKEFFETYDNAVFINKDGSLNTTTNVMRLTNLLMGKGLVRNNTMQEIGGVKVYPKEYFSPYDYINCIKHVTPNSYCMHHFYVSWMPWTERLKKMVKKFISGMIGEDFIKLIRRKMSK